MPRTHRPYPAEFRQRMLELVRAGRRPEQLAKEFGLSAQTIWNWVKQADLDGGRRSDGLTSAEKDEVQRLRREVRTLREEREILKNESGAWWAPSARRETRVFVESIAREERPSAFWCS